MIFCVWGRDGGGETFQATPLHTPYGVEMPWISSVHGLLREVKVEIVSEVSGVWDLA